MINGLELKKITIQREKEIREELLKEFELEYEEELIALEKLMLKKANDGLHNIKLTFKRFENIREAYYIVGYLLIEYNLLFNTTLLIEYFKSKHYLVYEKEGNIEIGWRYL